MTNFPLYFLSLMSVGAVLLGICVSLRNSAHSSLISEDSTQVQVGDQEYERILERSAYRSLLAGIGFLVVTIVSLAGFHSASPDAQNPSELTEVLYFIDIVAFIFGAGFLAWALLCGAIQHHSPLDGPPETEPKDQDDSS